MQLRKTALSLTAAAVLAGGLFATPVLAQDQAEGDYGRAGFFFGGDVVLAVENHSDPIPGVTDTDNSWGYDLRAGYRISSRWAVEAEWEHWTSFDQGRPDPARGVGGEAEIWLLTANARRYIGTGAGRTQAYLLGGVGVLSVDESGPGADSDLGATFRVGLGIDRYVTDNLAITGEFGYVIPLGGVQSYDTLPFSLGIVYRL